MRAKFKVVIIDDEPASTQILNTLLKELPEIGKIYSFNDSVTGFEKIQEIQPDILFLDLNMPKLSGLDILRFIKSYKLHIHVIIISAQKRKILDASKYDITSYLLKPFDREDIKKAVEIYYDHKEIHKHNFTGITYQPKKIRIPTSFEELFFSPDEIYYLEADGNYTNIFSPEKNKVVSSFHLGKISKLLPPDTFYRISRKTVININYLKKIDKRKKVCILNHLGKELNYTKSIIIKSGLLAD